jgi:glycosyltransferase involved in cell wall biosynthesis
MRDNMNILLVRNVFIRKRYYMSDYIQLTKSLNNLGHNAILVGLDDKNKYEENLILLKSTFNKRRFFLIKLTFFIPLICIIKRIDVVIVDDRVILGTLLLLILKKILGIKIILDIRSIPVEADLQFDYPLSCRIANKYYDGTTFITTATKDFIEQIIKKKFNRYAIFPSAVNPNLFSPTQINNVPDNIKQEIQGKIVIFYHGSISPNRGINLILDAVNQVKSVFPNILFISVSEGNSYITDYCASKKYKFNDNLLLLNVVKHEQMAAYINLADICIIPLPRILWWEISSPLKLMEYLAMEKPIILSDIKAHLSVVPQNSNFALFFNPDDPYDLEKKIIEAINNIDHLKNNSSMGREIVLKKYTWDIQAKILENFIRNL